MHKISLKDWVILLTILPTTIIGFSIAGYFSYSRYIELDQFINVRSQSIIEPLAIASAAPILNKDRAQLHKMISFAHRSQSNIVKSIVVFTKDNQIFVTSEYHGFTNSMRVPKKEDIPSTTTIEELGDYLIFRTPIIIENETVDHLNKHQINAGYIAIQIDRNKIMYDQQTQILYAFLIVILGSLISSFFALRLIKKVIMPVNSMVKAVDRIREGKLGSRVSGQLIGELHFLKNGINAMAKSLGDYQDEMQRSIDQATIDLRESLEQFEIQNVELDISKRKAQEANRVKSEFLANMSHELRTPLNGVIGFTRQVLKTPLSETQRDYLQTIERSANNLLAIINDILDFSKLDAGKMRIEKIPFSMRESVEETLALLAPSAHKKNIDFSLRIAQQLPDSFIGDAMRIKQIIINLASNAIKFTDKGSVCIDIDSETIDSFSALVKVTVIDTGVGIDKEQQKSIFEAFGQADKSVTRLYGGTGLGLVISQRLAKEMQGSIGFSSNKNQGSSFWFTFKCEINPLPLLSMRDTNKLSGKRILYFEPHAHSRIATSEIMENWDMLVHQVTSLKQLEKALKQKTHYDFALITHDISPAALNDLKNLIASIKLKVPSIHLAVNSNSPNLQEALIASGASSCSSKPITPTRLSKVLMPQIENNKVLANEKIIPVKVLAVDDNEANLKLIKALLLEQVSEVITATNGQEAVNLCQNEKFALIYMDIQMPIMDGVTALSVIKTSTLNDDTPFIAVTAHALSGEKEKLLQQGFNSYMTKPINETMLRHTIYEYCDLNLIVNAQLEAKIKKYLEEPSPTSSIVDWSLALKRAEQKVDLAKEMLTGLAKSLPETKLQLNEALICQDVEQIKIIIHKLSGACCYSGVPNLGKITQHLETKLKSNVSLDDLEPEFMEFFEHLDNVMIEAPKVLDSLNTK
ncbi:MAG: two-component sensor histidine kinase BarA [Alteromonadaceae bacterium]|nr:two-component sensor histidine kinase BarA [Alteromonadaceae bacterium]